MPCTAAGTAAVSKLRPGACVLLLVALGALQGCGDHTYEAARRADTADAYQRYLRAFPGGAHAEDAGRRLAALADDSDWRDAVAAASTESFRRYLGRHASGLHSRSAQVALAALESGAALRPAATEAVVEAAPMTVGLVSEAPVPTPTPVRESQARVADGADDVADAADIDRVDTAGFRVQLGAFVSGSAAARAAWRRLTTAHPYLEARRPVIAAARSRDGVPIHRLQVAGLTRESAASLCAALLAGGEGCVIEAPADRRH